MTEKTLLDRLREAAGLPQQADWKDGCEAGLSLLSEELIAHAQRTGNLRAIVALDNYEQACWVVKQFGKEGLDAEAINAKGAEPVVLNVRWGGADIRGRLDCDLHVNQAWEVTAIAANEPA